MNKNNINKTVLLAYMNGEIKDKHQLNRVRFWIESSNRNKDYYLSIKKLWLASQLNDDNLSSIKQNIWSRIETKEFGQSKTKIKITKSINTFYKPLAYAASLLFIISLGIVFYLVNQGNNTNNFYSFKAKAGSKSEVTLPDGTLVYLNSDSELRLPHNFSAGNRNVRLIGEAYFKVKKTEKRDIFIVNTEDIAVKVLGTEFNIKSYPDEGTIETTLEEGKIKIQKEYKSGRIQELAILEPNQRAVFVKKEGNILLSEIEEELNNTKETETTNDTEIPKIRKEELFLKEKINTKVYTSWKEGVLSFRSEKLSNLIIQMERWYGIDIKLENDSLSNIRFTGTLKNETIEQALDALKISQPFVYKMDVKNNIIYIN